MSTDLREAPYRECIEGTDWCDYLAERGEGAAKRVDRSIFWPGEPRDEKERMSA